MTETKIDFKYVITEMSIAAVVLFVGIALPTVGAEPRFHELYPDRNIAQVELVSMFENPVEWEKEKKESEYFLSDGTDLRKLSLAVAMHETRNCGIVTNFTVLDNCLGIKIQGKPAKFPATINGQRFETSHLYFRDLWKRLYGRFPDIELAIRYSGDDRPEAWLKNVTHFYYN